MPPPEPADSPLVRLSFVEDDALGESLEVLWNKMVLDGGGKESGGAGGSRTLTTRSP